MANLWGMNLNPGTDFTHPSPVNFPVPVPGKVFHCHGTDDAVEQDSRIDEGFLGLDPSTKYCLMDTMVLLPLRRADPDVTRDVKTELRGLEKPRLHSWAFVGFETTELHSCL